MSGPQTYSRIMLTKPFFDIIAQTDVEATFGVSEDVDTVIHDTKKPAS
jgi:hypothetical protein